MIYSLQYHNITVMYYNAGNITSRYYNVLRSDLSYAIRIRVHYRLSDPERFARNVSAFNEIRNASQRYNFTVSRCTVAPYPTGEYNSMVRARM